MIAAYHPLHDQTLDADCQDAHGNEASRRSEKLSILMILKLLYISIDNELQSLALNCLQGLRIETADNMRLRMYPV